MPARGFQKMMRLSMPALSSSAASGVKRSARMSPMWPSGRVHTCIRVNAYAYVQQQKSVNHVREWFEWKIGGLPKVWRAAAGATPSSVCIAKRERFCTSASASALASAARRRRRKEARRQTDGRWRRVVRARARRGARCTRRPTRAARPQHSTPASTATDSPPTALALRSACRMQSSRIPIVNWGNYVIHSFIVEGRIKELAGLLCTCTNMHCTIIIM